MRNPVLVLLLAAGAATPGAIADELFAAGNNGTLYRIDTDTGVVATVGPTGFSQIGGLAFGDDGKLYGMDASGDQLLEVDPQTGQATVVGPLGRPVTFSTGLGFRTANGDLYGVTQEGAGFSGFLVRVDPATGQATSIGDTGADAIVGLDFDDQDTLWGIDGAGTAEHLVMIDPDDASLTVVNPQGLAAFPLIGAFDIGPSGRAWAVHANTELLGIDLATGEATIVATLDGLGASGVTGLASPATGCPADLDGDGDADADDFFAYLDAFAAGDLEICDIDGDGDCDADDFFGYLDRFAQGC